LNTKRDTHTQFVELKYKNRHKLKGTLRAKQKVSIRCIMCGDMRRVAKVVVRQLFGSFMVRGYVDG
ncbi:unnamed protein product, partial [Brassica oleracea]